MSGLRLGQVEYVNCLPVYHALEEGILPTEDILIKGPPTRLNRLFLAGELDVTPISSIEYARNIDKCIILPNLSISADGRVDSILFFHRVPITELDGKKICITTSSATSVVLLKVLFEHYYHVDVEFCPKEPDLVSMLAQGDAALLIGDDAMKAHQQVLKGGWPIQVTDVGEAWKQFTGERMVYALWVIRRDYAEKFPHEADRISNLLNQSKILGLGSMPDLLNKAVQRTGLDKHVLENYFKTIQLDLSEDHHRAIITFFDYAYKSGLIEERVKLNIWGENQ